MTDFEGSDELGKGKLDPLASPHCHTRQAERNEFSSLETASKKDLDWSAAPIGKQLALGLLFIAAFLITDGSSAASQAWEGSPPWYPPVGLSQVLLLCGGIRYTPLLFAASITAAKVNYHWPLFSWGGIPGSAAVYLGYVGGACLLRGRWRIDLRFRSLRDVGRYLAVSLGAAIWSASLGIMALLGAGRIHRSGALWATAQWWASDFITVVVFSPFILLHVAPHIGRWLRSKKNSCPPNAIRRRSLAENLQLLAQISFALLAIWLVFGYAPAMPYQPLYLLFLPVIWVSVRKGLPGAVLATFTITIGMMFAAWITQAHKGSLPRLQLAMLALGLTGLCLGAVVTERKRAEQSVRDSERRFRLLFERNLAGVFRTTMSGQFLECNQATASIFGYESPKELLAFTTAGSAFLETHSDRDAFLARIKSEKSLTNYEMKFRRRNGDPLWTMLNVNLVSDEAGPGEILEATMIDITKRKLAEERAQSLAYYDALTGLPNRILLQDRLTKALAAARRQKRKVALLFADLDRFKIINDSLGHSVGDLLLKEVAKRLARCAREQDTVARLGGDEFLIVLTDAKDIPGVAVAAERFMAAICAGYTVQGHSLSVSCSLGISIFPDHGTDNETLIKNADAAMYSAKERGPNNFYFFSPEMNIQAVKRLALESDLHTALAGNQLFLVYQPQMDIATGRTTGVEALLRWKHPELGLVPPGEFIRIAENSGQIVPIGEWVLRTACAQARKWHDDGLVAVPVAVNVSAVQFRQEDFPQTVRRVLRETGLDPQYLELELTESLLLSNADVVFSVLEQLTSMGLKMAIDDFGTGYSSLSYLKRFPVHKLKIDRSFIRDVALNYDDAAITAAIVSMGKSLNLVVVAEGVENEAQFSFLRTQRCDGIQGYYFSKPLAASELAEKLRDDCPATREHAP